MPLRSAPFHSDIFLSLYPGCCTNVVENRRCALDDQSVELRHMRTPTVGKRYHNTMLFTSANRRRVEGESTGVGARPGAARRSGGAGLAEVASHEAANRLGQGNSRDASPCMSWGVAVPELISLGYQLWDRIRVCPCFLFQLKLTTARDDAEGPGVRRGRLLDLVEAAGGRLVRGTGRQGGEGPAEQDGASGAGRGHGHRGEAAAQALPQGRIKAARSGPNWWNTAYAAYAKRHGIPRSGPLS